MTVTGIAAKVAYVLRQGQTRDHRCHWPGCLEMVPPARWGCRPHWYLLPAALRTAIWRTYRPGQEVDGTPSADYLAVALRVQEWIARHTEALDPKPGTMQRLLDCPSCGAAVPVVFTFDDREGCAACWCSGAAASSPGHDDGPQRAQSLNAARLVVRAWSKGSARNAGPPKATGSVWVQRGRLVECPKCRRFWYGGEVHARRIQGGRWVNCIGEPVVERDGRWQEAAA